MFFVAGSFVTCTKNNSDETSDSDITKNDVSYKCPCENNLGVYNVQGEAYLFHSPISALQEEKLMQEWMANGYVAWIVYTPTTEVATLRILSKKETSWSIICNYHEFANFIENCSTDYKGTEVYYEGTAFSKIVFESAPPSIYYDLVITTFKKI